MINQAIVMGQDQYVDFKQSCQADEKVKHCTWRLDGITLTA